MTLSALNNQKQRVIERRVKPSLPHLALRTLFRGLGPLLPGLMGDFAYKLWFTPRRLPRPERETVLLETASEHFKIMHQGRAIAVHAWGQGPVVLLLHGWEGRGAQLGGFVAPLVEAGYRVLCLDTPAHGDSEGSQTDAEEIRQILVELAFNEDGFHAIIAHSFGGVAAAYAIGQGLPVEKLVLISPPSRLKTMLGIFRKHLAIPAAVMPRLYARIERRFPQMGRRVWDLVNTDYHAEKFDFPGLIFHDRDDRIVPLTQAELIANAWSASRLIVTRGLGHHRILRDAEVIRIAAEFIGPSITAIQPDRIAAASRALV